jgi:ABC-2 type transport system ATP-binding protein
MKNTHILKVHGISKTFEGKKVLSDVSFNISHNENLGIIGPNGAGKTTLLYIILGLIVPDKGTVYVDGLNLNNNLRTIRRRINFASSVTRLQGFATIKENLSVYADLYGVKNKQTKIDYLIKQFDLVEPYENNLKSFKLSSGQSVKLNLCKALINNPKLLFLDEPTAGLDAIAKKKFTKIIRRLVRNKKTVIIYSSHNLKELIPLCDKSIVLSKGKIVFFGKTNQLTNSTLKRLYQYDN